MKNRITPSNVQSLWANQVFVFGSNRIGRHGKGAAKTALRWGAKYGVGEGMSGRTYAIPTKGSNVYRSLTLHQINNHVATFVQYAKDNAALTFLVTEVGCGLAGYTPSQIAPMFEKAVDLHNVWLPESFWKELQK